MRSHELAERALEWSTSPDCVVLVEETSHVDVRWARSTLTTNGEHRTTSVTVIAIDGPRSASRSVTNPTPDRLRDLVSAVEVALREVAPSGDDAPLAEGQGTCPDWDAATEVTSSAALDSVARQLGEAFADPALEHFGYAEHETTTTWLASSTGLRLRHCQPQGRLELTAKSHERSRSSWWGAAHEDLNAVDIGSGVDYLRRSLGWQARALAVEPGRHAAILTPGAVGDLMVDLWWSAVGKDAVEGRSVFSAPGGGVRIGERLADPRVLLVSDPADPVIPSAPFETVAASSAFASVYDNGLALVRTPWIEDGTLTALIGSRRSAADTGAALRLSPSGLRMEVGGAGDLEDVIARTHDGLLVTCLWYNRVVDPQTLLLTGLTRDGVYVVRDGEVIGSAGNFRFNDSPVAMLTRILDAGRAVRTLPREFGDYAPRVVMPTVVFDGFHLSTRSDAL